MAELSYGLIIFLVILGCIVSAVIGYAVHYVTTNGFYRNENRKEMSEEQRKYMHMIRMENRRRLAYEVG